MHSHPSVTTEIDRGFEYLSAAGSRRGFPVRHEQRQDREQACALCRLTVLLLSGRSSAGRQLTPIDRGVHLT
jgi:hypothetical protein